MLLKCEYGYILLYGKAKKETHIFKNVYVLKIGHIFRLLHMHIIKRCHFKKH